MKRGLFFTVLMAIFMSFNAMSQCGQVGLVGEMTGWNSDVMLTRDMNNPDMFSGYITVGVTDDLDTNGIVEMKFRANHEWTTNWGSLDFPTGTAVQGGDNIQVPYGSYAVAFNCTTGDYTFTTTCGNISLIGEFNGWADDLFLTRNTTNPDMWWGFITVTEAEDADTNGIVEMKFRANSDWGTNWGGAGFPTDTAVQDGSNIPVPYGTYKVMFNCSTGVYNFVATCGNIGLIGEFNGWADDYWMTRSTTDPDEWSVIFTVTAAMDADSNGIIELKFRANSDWGTNWGGDEFPSGTGTQDGSNIQVPLDDEGLTTDYAVTFNCATGEYNFVHTSGSISMIGAFNNWNGDVPMHRDATNPNLWKLTRSWFADSEVKFRENNDWTTNWGAGDWPTGVGEDNGTNIPLVAGTYDVTFDYDTKDYTFTANNDVCGEVGMVGDFNTWGDDGTGVPTDVYLVRDAMYPSQFSLTYNFTSSTQLLFRMNADPTFADVWGGTFPSGQAVNDPSAMFNVPGGKYNIIYNCVSHDFNFERLGNAIVAPQVFAMDADGNLNEPDWSISQSVSATAEGTPIETPIEAYFGAVWNSDYMYVGVDVADDTVTAGDVVDIFFDGDKSGGPYDAHDVHVTVSSDGTITVVQGSDIVVTGGAVVTDNGYSVEVAIPYAALGVTPETGAQAGIDVMVGDDNGEGVAYRFVWNGGIQDLDGTSSFGDLNYGALSCGCISLYNETIGDVKLRNQIALDNTTTYVGTYDLDNAYDVMFRKDASSTVSWSSDEFPAGTATLGGPRVPATAGRYRISFDCITGAFSFGEALSGDAVADATYTETAPVIDGDLSEYNLAYGSDILAVGDGPINNTVTWGTLWDANNLYIGVHVVDAVVEGSGNPWDNDAIEMYIDGDNSKDGTYSAESFDTQLIMDAMNDTALWAKADGVPITDETSTWVNTSDGYSIELRLGWAQFGFAPGKGRTIGWSLSNNDSDNGMGRDYQSTWYGNGNNWSDNTVLGDLELAGGPYYVDGLDEHVLYNANVVLYPNPAQDLVNIRVKGDVFTAQADLYVTDITGRVIIKTNANFKTGRQVQISTSNLTTGIYFVNIMSKDGKRAVKKLIVQ